MTVRLVGLASAAALGVSLLLAPPAQAGEVDFYTSLGEGSLGAFRYSYEVSGCTRVPVWMAVYPTDPDVYWSANVTARLEGTAVTNSAYLSATGSSFEKDYFFMCPGVDGAGRWLVTGEITLIDYETGRETSARMSTSFRMEKATTRISIERVKASRNAIEVKGETWSWSRNYGSVGAPGAVRIQVPNGRKWADVGTGYADNRGKFTIRIEDSLSRESRLRAVYSGSDAAKSSVSLSVSF